MLFELPIEFLAHVYPLMHSIPAIVQALAA